MPSVRPARADDLDTIVDFNRRLAEESEGKTLDPEVLRAGVLALLDEPAHGHYFLAEEAAQVVGQLMVTYEWSDWRNGQLWWIQSVYVEPAWRRQGIFALLYRHVETLARKASDVPGLRLYVESNNVTAQATYARMGMERTGYLVMESMFEGD